MRGTGGRGNEGEEDQSKGRGNEGEEQGARERGKQKNQANSNVTG